MPRFSGTYTFGRNILTVAASDTPNRFKEGSDFICDGVADETEINAALTQAKLEGGSGSLGSCVMLLPGTYTIAASINMNSSNQGVGLIGYTFTDNSTVILNGPALGSTTPVILIRDTTDNASSTGGFLIRGIRITGNGYGIELNGNNGTDNEGVASITIEDCHITNCGNYGIYGHGSCWTIVIDKCRVMNNSTGQTGVNSSEIYFVTPNSTEQNGNALRITNSRWGGTAARGLVWNAAGLYVAGCDIEGSGNIGIDIGANTTNGPRGITIIGCYLEGWSAAAIRLGDSGVSVTTHAAAGVNTFGFLISGNYINNGGSSSGVQLSQVSAGFVIGNSFTSDSTGPSIRSITTSESTIIGPIEDEGSTRSTLNAAIVLGDYQTSSTAARRIRLNGDSQQAGLAWTAGSFQSDNFAGLGAQNGYWHLPVKPGDYIQSFSINAGGDATDTIVVALERLSGNIGGVYGTTWDTVTLDAGSNTNPSDALNASSGIIWTCIHRIESGYVYRLRTTFTPAAGGTRTVRPPTLHYVTE